MPAIKLLNLFALSTFAILLCSLAPSHTLALSVRSDHMARELPNHHAIAKKKRANGRCRPRSSSSTVPPTSTPASSPPKTNSPVVELSPSTTSPPASVETKPPNNTPSGPGKLAIAWAMGNDQRFKQIVSTGRVKMVHLWGAEIPSIVKASGIPVSIMLWGTSQDKIDNFVKFAKPGYASHAFGFNEVNEHTQAATDPDTAVSVWYKYLRPLANQGYTLGCPSTTSNPNGHVWVTEFFKKCGGDCHVDEVPIHWYDVKFEDLKAYINKWAGFGKPLRLTEFACQNFNGGAQPSMDEIWSFTDQAIKYMESDDRIMSYAPFGFMDDMYNVAYTNRLFSSGGLTDLGWKYVNGK